MNLAHLHIVLNHVPTLGSILALVLLVWSLVKKNQQMNKISLQILVVVALLVLPTYLSGNAAQWLIQDQKIQASLIDEHENSAMMTLVLMTITGTFAWFGLWQFRRFSRPGSMNTMAVLILSLLTTAVILRTANLGGKISHPEVRYGAVAAVEEGAGWRAPISLFANTYSWVWPASETLHFIGMTLLFAVALLVNLRMLGMMKIISFSALHRLLPLGILGFVLNIVTGMVFYIASPEMYFLNAGFAIKMFLIVLAGITVIYFTVFEQPWVIGPNNEAPLSAKIISLSTTGMLLGAMYFGRMLPFLRN